MSVNISISIRISISIGAGIGIGIRNEHRQQWQHTPRGEAQRRVHDLCGTDLGEFYFKTIIERDARTHTV